MTNSLLDIPHQFVHWLRSTQCFAKVKAIHTDARHVMCAARIPSRSFHNHQDYYDDDEHNAGKFLLQLLETSEIMNRVLIVVRIYDGTHVGERRFRAIRDAAISAVDKSSKNEVTGQYDTIWMDGDDTVPTYNYRFTFGKTRIRGGGGGRGGRGGSQQNRQPLGESFQSSLDPETTWADVVKSPNKESATGGLENRPNHTVV